MANNKMLALTTYGDGNCGYHAFVHGLMALYAKNRQDYPDADLLTVMEKFSDTWNLLEIIEKAGYADIEAVWQEYENSQFPKRVPKLATALRQAAAALAADKIMQERVPGALGLAASCDDESEINIIMETFPAPTKAKLQEKFGEIRVKKQRVDEETTKLYQAEIVEHVNKFLAVPGLKDRLNQLLKAANAHGTSKDRDSERERIWNIINENGRFDSENEIVANEFRNIIQHSVMHNLGEDDNIRNWDRIAELVLENLQVINWKAESDRAVQEALNDFNATTENRDAIISYYSRNGVFADKDHLEELARHLGITFNFLLIGSEPKDGESLAEDDQGNFNIANSNALVANNTMHIARVGQHFIALVTRGKYNALRGINSGHVAVASDDGSIPLPPSSSPSRRRKGPLKIQVHRYSDLSDKSTSYNNARKAFFEREVGTDFVNGECAIESDRYIKLSEQFDAQWKTKRKKSNDSSTFTAAAAAAGVAAGIKTIQKPSFWKRWSVEIIAQAAGLLLMLMCPTAALAIRCGQLIASLIVYNAGWLAAKCVAKFFGFEDARDSSLGTDVAKQAAVNVAAVAANDYMPKFGLVGALATAAAVRLGMEEATQNDTNNKPSC